MDPTAGVQQWEGCSSSDLGCVWHVACIELPVPQAGADLIQISVDCCCPCPHHHCSPQLLQAMRPAHGCVGSICMLATAHSTCNPTTSFGTCQTAPVNAPPMLLCCLQALAAHKLCGGRRLRLLQALREAQMRAAALPSCRAWLRTQPANKWRGGRGMRSVGRWCTPSSPSKRRRAWASPG